MMVTRGLLFRKTEFLIKKTEKSIALCTIGGEFDFLSYYALKKILDKTEKIRKKLEIDLRKNSHPVIENPSRYSGFQQKFGYL